MSNLCHIISVNTKQTDKSLQFFSIRRRHTRCGRDWSSDVCSSDLGYCEDIVINQKNFEASIVSTLLSYKKRNVVVESESKRIGNVVLPNTLYEGILKGKHILVQIGRASCRERV